MTGVVNVQKAIRRGLVTQKKKLISKEQSTDTGEHGWECLEITRK